MTGQRKKALSDRLILLKNVNGKKYEWTQTAGLPAHISAIAFSLSLNVVPHGKGGGSYFPSTVMSPPPPPSQTHRHTHRKNHMSAWGKNSRADPSEEKNRTIQRRGTTLWKIQGHLSIAGTDPTRYVDLQ